MAIELAAEDGRGIDGIFGAANYRPRRAIPLVNLRAEGPYPRAGGSGDHAQVLRCLCIRHAAIPDQRHRLKLHLRVNFRL